MPKERLTLQEMHRLAENNGGKCLSREYVRSNIKLKWQCRQGHIWEALQSNIKCGHWCPYCSGQGKPTIEELNALAQGRGGRCLSTEYVNNHTLMIWECEMGHIWKATSRSIKNGSWCSICSGKEPITIELMHDIAKQRGGRCLSTVYRNSYTKLEWECEKGHRWKVGYNSISVGSWCPKCGRERVSRGWGDFRETRLTKIKELARQRGGECISEKYVTSQDKLEFRCKRGHTWKALPGNILKGHWCSRCSAESANEPHRHKIETFKEIAKNNGGECLSKFYKNNKTNLHFRCKWGHNFFSTPSNILRGSWCPKCARNVPYTIIDMKELAKQKGGECLSEEYTNSLTKLKWSCKYGHCWDAIPSGILQGHWCPICGIKSAGMKRRQKKEDNFLFSV